MMRSSLVAGSVVFLSACASAPPSQSTTEPTPAAQAAAATTTAAAVASASFTATAPTASAVAAPEPPKADPPAAPAPLPEGLKVLVIGDSFAEALGSGIRGIKGEIPVHSILRGEHATFIPQWAGPKFGVPLMLKQETPDVVIIALGGNELAMVNPSQRTPDIEKIVGFMGDIPCVWVGTPSFGKENDLPQIIRSHSSPCRYYDSNALSPNLPRGSDKIHPTSDGQKIWARQVLSWLAKERDASKSKFALSPRPAGE